MLHGAAILNLRLEDEIGSNPGSPGVCHVDSTSPGSPGSIWDVYVLIASISQ